MTDIDTEHPIMLAFRAVGYDPEDLVDPSAVTAEDIGGGDWRIVEWNVHGVEMFDVGADDVDTDAAWSPSGAAVAYGSGKQPIAFDGTLYGDISDMSILDTAGDPRVVFFVAPGTERHVEIDGPEAAVRALTLWGHRGWVPSDTAVEMTAAVGASMEGYSPKDDPDAGGVSIIPSEWVAHSMADAIGEPAGPDGDAEGTDKRSRQRFYRNLDLLKDHFGVADDWYE